MGPRRCGARFAGGRCAKGAEAGRCPRASRDRSRAGGGGIPCTFTWWPGLRLRWCTLPPRTAPHALSAVARCAPPPRRRRPFPPCLVPGSPGRLKGALCPRSTPSGPKPASPLLGVVPSPAPRGSGGRSSPGEGLSAPCEEDRPARVQSSGARRGCRRARGRASCWGVGRDCGVVAGGPSPARWPGPAGGRVGVLGCRGTALVLEALGGGTPCALAADLGPWKAPLRVPCAPSRRPAVLFPRGCSGFQRLCPLPPSRCLAASPRLPADPVPRPGALVLLRPVAASHPCLPPPARRWCRVRTRDRSSRPPPCAAPLLRRACPGVGRVPAGRRGRCGRALPPPGVGGGRAPARLPSPRGSARRPAPAPVWPTGAPAPPARRHRGRPGVWGVGASLASPRRRCRCALVRGGAARPVSLARRCG